MEKKCNKCSTVKDLSEFSNNKTRKDGHQCQCKICMAANNRRHYKRTKSTYMANKSKRMSETKQWFREYKQTLKCEKCNEDRWYILDFHHNDPETKELEVCNCVRNGWKIERITKEIEKCSVLCSNCHRELHYLENIRA